MLILYHTGGLCLGVPVQGGSLSRGVSVGGFSVQGDPLPPVDRHTLVKTLPCPKPRLRMVKIIKSVADPGFSRGAGAPSPKRAFIFQFFCRKLHENERIWTPRVARVPGAPLDQPMKMIDTGNSLMGKKVELVLSVNAIHKVKGFLWSTVTAAL